MTASSNSSQVAYFSMEMALDPSVPTYSGGLGVLAGDTLRAAADLGMSMVGVSLVHRNFSSYDGRDKCGCEIESDYRDNRLDALLTLYDPSETSCA